MHRLFGERFHGTSAAARQAAGNVDKHNLERAATAARRAAHAPCNFAAQTGTSYRWRKPPGLELFSWFALLPCDGSLVFSALILVS